MTVEELNVGRMQLLVAQLAKVGCPTILLYLTFYHTFA